MAAAAGASDLELVRLPVLPAVRDEVVHRRALLVTHLARLRGHLERESWGERRGGGNGQGVGVVVVGG